jgi:hemerythrin-like domain-containing protein
MLERLLLPDKHAIAILMKDHDTVDDLFEKFEKTDSKIEKDKIIKEAITELKIHAVIEEEIFYPAVRKHVGSGVMNEADEEHHVARVLIAELDHTRRENDHRDAKFTVLAESVRHHITEEENEMFPKAKRLDIDFEALGEQLLVRKSQLKKDGIPADAEHAMVAAVKGKNDTPAAAARRGHSRRKTARKPAAARTSKRVAARR